MELMTATMVAVMMAVVVMAVMMAVITEGVEGEGSCFGYYKGRA